MKKRLPIITTSEIKTFQRCQRLHQYRYTLGYRPIERAQPLEFGSLIHAGLETWWKTAGDHSTTHRALAEFHAQSALTQYDLVRASVMLDGYHARWLDEPISVVAVEQEFRVPITMPDGTGHRVDLAGKFDSLCSIDGKAFVPEHKSKSEKVDTAAYFEQLRADLQVSNYLIAAHAIGHEPGGVLYDVLIKPPEPLLATPVENRKYTKDGKLYARQRDADETLDTYRERLITLITENPDNYYQRATITRYEEELDRAMVDLWHMAEAITAPRAYAPRSPGACRDYSRNCDFWEVCWGSGSLEDSAKYERMNNPHEELAHATSNAAE